MDPKIFKAYDIRGIYPQQINEEIVYKIGRAFVEFLNPKTVVIGRDIRLSSDRLFEALASGIAGQGAEVIDIGHSTTDMLYFSVANYKYSAGIMITASHNPPQYNGLKFVREKSIPISGDTGIKDIQKLVKKDLFKKTRKGRVIKKEIIDDFIGYLSKIIDFSSIKPLKVVIDGGNGTAGLIVKTLFKRLPVEIIPLYLDPDGTFPNHEPDPLVEKNRIEIMAKVKETNADLGLAFDGDCDRCFFIDDKGDFVPGDIVLALFAGNLLQRLPNSKILYDVRSSWAVKDTVDRYGGEAIEYRVGHAFMKQKMRDEGALLGGEVSGHYYFKDFFNCDSGIVSAMLMMQLISKNNKLSQLVRRFSSYHLSGEINSTVEDKDDMIRKLGKIYKDGKIHHIDGISVMYDSWHFNVRKSNTEPLLRLNLEANSQKLMEQKRDEVLAIIRNKK